jgi:hypothetical protein
VIDVRVFTLRLQDEQEREEIVQVAVVDAAVAVDVAVERSCDRRRRNAEGDSGQGHHGEGAQALETEGLTPAAAGKAALSR